MRANPDGIADMDDLIAASGLEGMIMTGDFDEAEKLRALRR